MTVTSVATPVPPSTSKAELQKAAADFEALLISQLLKSARVDHTDGDSSMESLNDMAEEQLAKLMVAGIGLGFRQLIMNGLAAKETQATSSKGE